MKTILKNHSFKQCIIVTIQVILITLFFSACSLPIERRINQAKVNDFYLKASVAVIKYGDEPVSGELRTFPASFSLTGKAVLVEVPLFEGMDPLLPVEVYERFSLSDYSWYTSDPSKVRYVILIDKYYAPSDENGLGDSLIFTIVDLSYNEMVYKSFLKGNGGFPYRELADLLEDLIL